MPIEKIPHFFSSYRYLYNLPLAYKSSLTGHYAFKLAYWNNMNKYCLYR